MNFSATEASHGHKFFCLTITRGAQGAGLAGMRDREAEWALAAEAMAEAESFFGRLPEDAEALGGVSCPLLPAATLWKLKTDHNFLTSRGTGAVKRASF
eukprot:scaffold225179_cov39-Prasinocladus_malaysianus.AAC.1